MRKGSAVIRMESERLCVEYFTTRDSALRSRIVEEHQWLVRVCARQMQRRAEPLDDLVQVGNIGLLQALERFDPAFGVSFRTFASTTVLGVLRRHYRSTWRITVPRRVQDLHLLVSRAIETLGVRLQRSPTIGEIAHLLAISETDVIEAIEAGANFWPLSFTQSVEATMQSDPRSDADDADSRLDVTSLLAALPPLERQILYLRFFEECTQAEIGERLGLNQVHVSRSLRAALVRLRSMEETRILGGF